jgi:ABC-type nickel/cobalt efflux system permease component RcnA
MVTFRFRQAIPAFCAGILLPTVAFAQRQLNVSIGTSFNVDQIVSRVVSFLAATITTVASAMFVVGAFMIVLAGAKEDYKQRGKDLMIGSLLSVATVLGAYAIYRTVAYFLNFVQ